jgi:LacI family transcriptional regulator
MNLKEFSRLVGLSETTVSRALSGYPEVKAATRQRVQEAAIKLGYHPNRSAAGLATGRAGAVGIVFRGESEYGPHTAEFVSGLGTRLERARINILLVTVGSREEELASYRRLAASRLVDAVVLHAPTLDDERVALLNQLGMPFVMHGRTEVRGIYSYVDIDNLGAVKRATSHLLDLGHRRIGFINGLKDKTFAVHRDRGFRMALAERGIEPDAALFGSGDFTDEFGFRFMKEFLANRQPPTAVLAGSMMSALGAMRAIRSAGLVLGRDISLIAHDDVFPYLNADNMVPTVSTTRSSIRLAGSRVAEFLLQLLAGHKPEELQEVWPVELVLRESTGPAPAARPAG